MKRQKILLPAFLLALLLLTGCGPVRQSGRSTPVPINTAPTEAELAEAAGRKVLALGCIQNAVYTNDYAGFSCRLDEGWSIYGIDQMQQLDADVLSTLRGTQLAEALGDYQHFTDMFAENSSLGCSITIVYEAIDPAGKSEYLLMTEEELVEDLLTQKDLLIQAYTDTGLTVTAMEPVRVRFLGNERTGIVTAASVAGLTVYSVQLLDYTLGEYGITVTLTSFGTDRCQEMLELFYPLT